MIRGTFLLIAVGMLRVWVSGPVEHPSVEPPPDELEVLLTASERAVSEQEERKRRLRSGETLDPNRASEIQLDRLPGVGPALAREIVDFREREGPFRQPSDLLAVHGFGPVALTRLTPLLDFSRGPPVGSAGPKPRRAARTLSQPTARAREKLALNSATAEELESVPGIGPVIAQRIVEFRRVQGRFLTLEDLLEVPGIGPRTLSRIRAYFRVRGRIP